MITRQEMFDRAWRGLKAQGWQWAYDKKTASCVYLDARGNRCAWGHVDPELTAGRIGSVGILAADGVGLAARLDERHLAFARDLQFAHDSVATGMKRGLETAMRDLASCYGLTIPDEAP